MPGRPRVHRNSGAPGGRRSQLSVMFPFMASGGTQSPVRSSRPLLPADGGEEEGSPLSVRRSPRPSAASPNAVCVHRSRDKNTPRPSVRPTAPPPRVPLCWAGKSPRTDMGKAADAFTAMCLQFPWRSFGARGQRPIKASLSRMRNRKGVHAYSKLCGVGSLDPPLRPLSRYSGGNEPAALTAQLRFKA